MSGEGVPCAKKCEGKIRGLYIKESDMKAKLTKDIVIPAGTIFDTAPVATQRYGDGHVTALHEFSVDNCGSIYATIDPGDDEAMAWWEIIE